MEAGLEVFPVGLGVIPSRKTVLHSRYLKAVDKEIKFRRILPCLGHLHHVLDTHCPVRKETGISFLLQLEHELHLVFPCRPVHVRKDIHGGRIAFEYVCHHVIDGVAFHFFAGHRRICPPDTGEYHAKVVVYLSAGCDGRTGVAGVHLLLDGDCRRDTFDKLDIRLGHASKELPCI